MLNEKVKHVDVCGEGGEDTHLGGSEGERIYKKSREHGMEEETTCGRYEEEEEHPHGREERRVNVEERNASRDDRVRHVWSRRGGSQSHTGYYVGLRGDGSHQTHGIDRTGQKKGVFHGWGEGASPGMYLHGPGTSGGAAHIRNSYGCTVTEGREPSKNISS